ncbi:MAG: zinc ribbon domain-containing protein, partial [Oscillospiraceae bacterium]|nr:zinc ribbon domain-containing protein [Oscillospiraceae bacterium]
MYCAHCGKPIPDEALFCQCCGNRCAQTPKEITKEIPAQPQSQPEMPTGIPLPPSQTMGRYAEASEDTPFSSQGTDRMTDGPGVPYKADEFEPKLPPSGKEKKKLPKWLWITICAVATVLIGLLILFLLNPEDLKPSSESEAPSASVAQQPADETAVTP